MLVLSRKVGEKIAVGENITIVINRISGNRVAIGIQAPESVRVLRGELEPFATAFDSPKKDTPPPAPRALAPAAACLRESTDPTVTPRCAH